MTSDLQYQAPWWRRCNWWKIGFFTALITFELVREVAVLAIAVEAKPIVSYWFFHAGQMVTARCVWKRIDGGGKLMPAAVIIECWRDRGQCVEAYAQMNGTDVYAPEVDWFDARFTAERGYIRQ